jgi:hypothetical protein
MKMTTPILVLVLIASGMRAGDVKTLPVEAFDGAGPKLGMDWQTYHDEHNLGTKVKPFVIVKDGSPKGSKGHGHFAGHMGKSKDPWPWAGVDLAFGDDAPKDLSAYTHLRFWAKGDGKKYRVRLGRDAVTDYCDFEYAFVAPKEWTPITAPLAEFTQPKWGKQVPRGFKDVKMLGFLALAPGDDEDFELRFTDLAFVSQPPAKAGKTIDLDGIGISLPEAVGDIKYQRRQAFDQKALGYSVSYGNKMCAITLIVYDLDQKDIPDGKATKHAQDQMRRSIEDLKSAEKKGFFKNLEQMKGDLPLPKSALETFATAGYTFDVKGGGCKSYILLTGRQKHFLKVRVTQYVVNEKTNDEEIGAFLTTLSKAVSGK